MTALVMLAMGIILQGLFERHVEREAEAQLDADLRYLARSVFPAEGGPPRVVQLPDPRFQEPYSGLYWQLRDDRTGETWRSPSLGGFTLALEPDALRPGEVHRHILIGPEGGKMIALERRIGEGAGADFRVVAAVDRKVLLPRVVTCVFEERKADGYKVISFMAKRARGLMVRYAVQHRASTPEQLKHFDLEGYRFNSAASGPDRLVFRREAKA
eukprot:gene49805-60969_t